jgi:hypothetical protein
MNVQTGLGLVLSITFKRPQQIEEKMQKKILFLFPISKYKGPGNIAPIRF